MHKAKAELFVCGYVRKEESTFKLYIPQQISQLVLEFYPTKYKVYGIGEHLCGQFGLGHTKNLDNYTKLEEITDLIDHPFDIYSGWYRNIIQNINDPSFSLYSVGNNSYNQCGLEYFNQMVDNVETLTKMHGISQKNGVTCISNGPFSNHTLFVYENNNSPIFGYGCNKAYQFGITPYSSLNNDNDNSIPILINYNNNNNPSLLNLNISKISCGQNWSLILTENGKVWSMGQNDKGQCGLNILENSNIIKNQPLYQI